MQIELLALLYPPLRRVPVGDRAEVYAAAKRSAYRHRAVLASMYGLGVSCAALFIAKQTGMSGLVQPVAVVALLFLISMLVIPRVVLFLNLRSACRASAATTSTES
jgi:hypothetical protein